MRAWKVVDNPARFPEDRYDFRELKNKYGKLVLHASPKRGAQHHPAPPDGVEFLEELPMVCPAITKKGTVCGKAPKKGSKWCGTHLRKRRKQ